MSYTQIVAPRTGTVDGAGWCLRFAQSVFGAPVAHPSAKAASEATKYRHATRTLPNASVLLWFDHWGTYGGVYANFGHVAVWVPGKGILTSPYYKAHGQEWYGSIADIERIFKAKFLFWSEDINGLRVVKPAALEPTQRQAHSSAPVKRREKPTTKSKDLGDWIQPGEVGNFNGWINGEVVNGNGVWFRGISGHWFWSGGFTSQSKSGLKDLNPAPAPTNKRKAQDLPVNIRSEAKASAKVVGSVNAKQEVSVAGWLKGEKVSGIDTWYKLSNGFAWAGGFTDSSTNGITKYVPPVKPEPEPEPKPEPELPTLKAFSPVVTRVDAAHRDNIMLEPFSKAQTDVVLHDFGTDGKDTFAGTVSWFKNPQAAASAHFVVSGTNIVQMVSLEHRAQHAGPQGNNHVGIEIDPAVGRSGNDQLKIDTIASVRKLLIALRDHYGVQLKTHKHSEFMSTECGDDIDLQAYDISEPVKPDDSEIHTKLDNILSLLQKLTDMFKAIFRIN